MKHTKINMEQKTDVECYEWSGGETSIITTENLTELDASNLIYMAEDGQSIGMEDLIVEEAGSAQDDATSVETFTQEEIVTEEIPNDWVQGEDCVQEITVVDQIGNDNVAATDIIPLPEAQDEYTASRPYPCDFCSRRFRKKANLMNHMIAHQNNRPHVCNLCGAGYIRKSDLLNHLKTHAYTEDGYNGLEDQDLVNFLDEELSGDGARSGNKINIDLEELLASPGNFNTSMNSFSNRPNTSNYRKKPQFKQQNNRSKLNQMINKPKKKPKPKSQPMRTPIKLTVNNSEIEEESEIKFPVTNPSKPFVCQRCGTAFARSKALTSHMRFHTGDILHECNVCGQQFYDKILYQKHFAKHFGEIIEPPNLQALNALKNEEQPIKDEFDDEATESDVEVGGHYDDPLFECQVCLISFHRSDLYEKHMKAHENSGKQKSDKKFLDTEVAFSEHDISGSSMDFENQRHCCNVCGEQFEEALDLLAHAEIHARSYQSLKCLLCGDQFPEESAIKFHIMEIHRHEMTENTCRLCGKLCKDGRTLMRHSWDHVANDGSFSCARCAKSFHNKARLKRHMATHKNKTVMCDTCGEELQDGRSLMNHKHLHTKSNQFHCSECGKTFGSRSSQQIHMRIHTGEKPYGCRYCWKAFADGGTLRKHERIHTGEKPYACPVCPRAFNQRVVLREHIRSHHSAPDMKLGSAMQPFYCPVCGDTFSSSQDLIKHLIEHSDVNTQAKRAPTQGPRKYKRRRNITTLASKKSTRKSQSSSMEFDDDDDFDSMNDPNNSSSQEMSIEEYATYSFRRLVPQLPDEEDFCLPQEILSDVKQQNEEVKGKDSSRNARNKPKMIHTEKVRDTQSNKRTRTLINRTETNLDFLTLTPSKIKPEDTSFPLLDDGKPLSVETSPDRNVKLDEDFLMAIVKKNKYTEKFNSDIVNDLKEILQSPVKPKIESSPTKIETPTRPRRNIKPSLKVLESTPTKSTQNSSYSSRIRIQNRKNTQDADDVNENIDKSIKEELEQDSNHECQICGDKFESRTLLMSHAQVHM
uniref:CSON009975 protein n=1 Tax=Culicoides sonorensis TaxID=179676 RepID=A0A336LH41_CULSO